MQGRRRWLGWRFSQPKSLSLLCIANYSVSGTDCASYGNCLVDVVIMGTLNWVLISEIKNKTNEKLRFINRHDIYRRGIKIKSRAYIESRVSGLIDDGDC
ncbi:hypothetical protein BJX61DRAFT_124784 [Aspergillus egyptiacus]|nr:hypothetical protein BJX61DRAFT_124784 [Aspergillus egyptiacus]